MTPVRHTRRRPGPAPAPRGVDGDLGVCRACALWRADPARHHGGVCLVGALLVLGTGALAGHAVAQSITATSPPGATVAQSPTLAPVVANVRKDGPGYAIDVSFVVAAPQRLVWDVLTDFDQMAAILSSVDSSKIVDRHGDEFDVEQRSHASAGPVRISLDSVRHVTLTPERQIRSRLITSASLSGSDFITELAPQGARVRVDVRGTFRPKLIASTVLSVGSIAAEVARQYTELRDEILRRQAGLPRPACLAKKDCP